MIEIKTMNVWLVSNNAHMSVDELNANFYQYNNIIPINWFLKRAKNWRLGCKNQNFCQLLKWLIQKKLNFTSESLVVRFTTIKYHHRNFLSKLCWIIFIQNYRNLKPLQLFQLISLNFNHVVLLIFCIQ